MTATAAMPRFRIGELARRVGATPRTVRYYEELGLLPVHGRAPARHRLYDADDETKLRELLRLRDILGLSLADLRVWVDADSGRARLRERWHAGDISDEERVAILREALQHVRVQLTLVHTRRTALEELEDELVAHRRRLRSLMHDLEGTDAA